MARKLESGGEAAAELLNRARQALAGRWPAAKEQMTPSRVEQIVRAVMVSSTYGEQHLWPAAALAEPSLRAAPTP